MTRPAVARPRRLLAALVLALGPAVFAAGCGGSGWAGVNGEARGDSHDRLTILAASSLQEVFSALGQAFEANRPGTTVTFSFGASSTLAQQAAQGLPVDVLASADDTSLLPVLQAQAASAPVIFARNRLAILVARGNPKGITGLRDLAAAGLVVVLCSSDVPCGRAAAQAVDQAGVALAPKSLEENVKAVVGRVVLGEADAGLVFATDVAPAGGAVEGIEVPDGDNVTTANQMVVLRGSPRPALAQAWVDFVLGPEGQQVLARAGFLAP